THPHSVVIRGHRPPRLEYYVRGSYLIPCSALISGSIKLCPEPRCPCKPSYIGSGPAGLKKRDTVSRHTAGRRSCPTGSVISGYSDLDRVVSSLTNIHPST